MCSDLLDRDDVLRRVAVAPLLGLLRVREGADDLGRRHALLDVEEGGGLIEEVDVGLGDGRGRNGKALELASRELWHLPY